MSRFLELFTFAISGKIEKEREYKFGFVGLRAMHGQDENRC